MVDIHCYILPNCDDGANSMETALLMAQMAVDSGKAAAERICEVISALVLARPHEEVDKLLD